MLNVYDVIGQLLLHQLKETALEALSVSKEKKEKKIGRATHHLA